MDFNTILEDMQSGKVKGSAKISLEANNGVCKGYAVGDTLTIITGLTMQMVETARRTGMPKSMLYMILTDTIDEIENRGEDEDSAEDSE